MADDDDVRSTLSDIDLEWLDPEKDYRWSGWLVQRKVRKPAKRIIVGGYAEWFRWYMYHQRFRAFHTIVLVRPMATISNREYGGYVDGLLARLMKKVRQVVIVSEPVEVPPISDELRTREVLRALLYGTRLSRSELSALAKLTFVPVTDEALVSVLEKRSWRISRSHPRYRLGEFDEELLQGMVADAPPGYTAEKPHQIEQLFQRRQRFRPEVSLPDKLLSPRILEDVGRRNWVTVPYEAEKLATWLKELNEHGDSRIIGIYGSNESISDNQWEHLLTPPKNQVRRVLDELVAMGKLEQRHWYREVGRPALAYVSPEEAPFLERRCGQCAFYASARRRCRIWWLVNKRQAFFDPRWKQVGSQVTGFEIHKMKYASRIGPHSSACMRFLDKKRDHPRKSVPEKCEICGAAIQPFGGASVTCERCRTKYVWLRGRVRVMTAYYHEYNRLYHEITGGNPTADLEAWRREMRDNLRIMQGGQAKAEDVDMLAEEDAEAEFEPPRIWPQFNQGLQEKVDSLASTTDIATQLSIAMARSALNATHRIIKFGNLYPGEGKPIVGAQEKYLTLVAGASPTKLLPYEALIMRQYWRCYGLALKGVQQWFGPRKRSRFVKEFVGDLAGRARGYSPVDAAINYLHQRRLRQAERVNAGVGFPGRCDGFLHKERHNSRKIGLLLDMIDPFKFADREELLLVLLDQGLTWRDFRIEADRRGSNFYYPMEAAKAKLDHAGEAADDMVVKYQNQTMRLSDAYRRFAESLLRALDSRNMASSSFNPFVFELPAEAH